MMENLFSTEEVDLLKREMHVVLKDESPRKILEKNGEVRSFFAPHQVNPVFDAVGKMARVVRPAEALLDSAVYIHQTKINSKCALTGDWWEWHQDFPYWHIEDGMPTPRVLTVMIYLDDVNEFNGPMLLIPGSHHAGLVDDDANNENLNNETEWFQQYQKSTTYMSNLTARLKYTLKRDTLQKWVDKNGIYAAKAPAGSALFFNGLVFHASANNLSPWSRDTYLVTYNSTENKLNSVENPRPDFLANPDATPIQAVAQDSLTAVVSTENM